eukprot:6259614-Prymnesium_polylepis.1
MCDREACFGACWGVHAHVWDACTKRNVKTTLRDPPSLAARGPHLFSRHPSASQSRRNPHLETSPARLKTGWS